jgi:DnaJ-class molecular chaperone
MVKDKTLYDRLEVDPSTPIKEIEKKGKKLLIKWHPDKNPDKVQESTKKFQEIQEAMTILTNQEKREMYDQFGMEGTKGGDGGGGFPGGGFPGGFPPGFPGGMFGGGFPFGGGGGGGGFPGGFPFGGGGGFPGHPAQRGNENENIVQTVKVTLAQIYNQSTIDVTYNQKVSCSQCKGEGTSDGVKNDCDDCGGKGIKMKMMRLGPIQTQTLVPCNICNGKGKIISEANKCTTCNASGFNTKEKTVQVPLQNGFGNGIKMQLEGKGNNINGQKSDLIVIINEEEDPVFKRRNSDLIVTIELKLFQALFGFDKLLTHLDGRKLHLHHTGKTNYGTVRRISGEGMTDLRTKQKGDLLIKFVFTLPNITNETLTKALILIDKQESVNEKELIKDTDLVKTMMLEDSSDAFSQQSSSSGQAYDEDEEQGPKQAECVQQ